MTHLRSLTFSGGRRNPYALCLLVILALPAVAELRVSSDFDGGSIGACETIAENHLECAVEGESDQDDRNRQATWYYFRLDGATGEEVTIDLVDLAGEYNYKPNNGGITDRSPPVVSYDRESWTHLSEELLDYSTDPLRFRFRFTPEQNPVWIAHVPPYTGDNLARLLDRIRKHKHLHIESVGRSAGGRDIPLLTITNPEAPDSTKTVVWLMFRQHSWESGSSWVGEGAIDYLLNGGRAADAICKRFIFKIFPLCDPDGVARGGVRFNNNGYDLNRNWDHVIPEKMPEIAAQKKAIVDWRAAGRALDLFLTVHNTETAEYLDGSPADAPGPHSVTLGQTFYLLRKDSMFSPTRGPKPSAVTTELGRMAVYQALYAELKIPAFLMELAISENPKTFRCPTVNDRLQFGEDLIRVISRSVRGRSATR